VQFILIWDQFGNADILFFGETFCSCNGVGCPTPGGSTCNPVIPASINKVPRINGFSIFDAGRFRVPHFPFASAQIAHDEARLRAILPTR
jgi:hypothetical protein